MGRPPKEEQNDKVPLREAPLRLLPALEVIAHLPAEIDDRDDRPPQEREGL